MARQIDGIRRMLLIINKIYATNGQYGDSCVSVHELLSYINDHVDAPISERTLQRDINDIEMLFHIEISLIGQRIVIASMRGFRAGRIGFLKCSLTSNCSMPWMKVLT